MILIAFNQYHQTPLQSVCSVRLVLAAPIYNLWHTTLRLGRHRADNEHLAAPVRTALIAERHGLIIFVPFKKAFLCQRLHRVSMAHCPPGSHSARQGLTYIVILYFDSAVGRMMFQAEDSRFMMLHVRSE